ncbi:MAG: PEGA domain-containing protein [Bacillus sp. (in: Bacteria)]|nr:PEGA domain-containing protein [Bacillus sp. (in: firmicutes)]MCM1425375.1 PEGA domain-containing protein [Eubacterium sp.]
MMNTMYKRLSVITTAFMILTLTITGCTSQASNIGLAREKDPNAIGTDFVVAEVGSYDSADTAVVVSTDMENGYVVFMNIATGKQYTLSYDGTTYVKDRHNGPMTISQIKEGDIVDITFLKSKKRLASVQLSPDSWVLDNIGNYDLGGKNKTAEIGSSTYSLPDEAMILSEGRRAEMMEIIDSDILTVSGIDHTIYSVNVERGHGYLRLSNEQALIGGWIEVGNAVVQRITEDMLLAVPEGSYQVLLSNENASCVKEVVIERNKEVVLDASDLEILQNKTGKILISVNPPTASVRVDGELIDTSEEVELTYGIHQIRLEAEGYQTMTKYIQVGSEYASINFIMEEGETEDENSVSDNSSVDDIANAVTGNRVYIDAPQGVEAYLDGNYVGVTPISFTKVTGDHTITLSKSGYVSKSYTIYLYDDGEDITYSFADLESEDETVSGSRRSSRNSTSTSKSSTSTKNIEEYSVTVKVKEEQEVDIYIKKDDSDEYKYITYGNEASFKVERGSYTIKLEKEGYRTCIRPVIINTNKTFNFSALLLGAEDVSSEEKLKTFFLGSESEKFVEEEDNETKSFKLAMTESDEPVELFISSTDSFSPDLVQWICNGNAVHISSTETGSILVEAKEKGTAEIVVMVKIGDNAKKFICEVTIEEGNEEPINPDDPTKPTDPDDTKEPDDSDEDDKKDEKPNPDDLENPTDPTSPDKSDKKDPENPGGNDNGDLEGGNNSGSEGGSENGSNIGTGNGSGGGNNAGGNSSSGVGNNTGNEGSSDGGNDTGNNDNITESEDISGENPGESKPESISVGTGIQKTVRKK